MSTPTPSPGSLARKAHSYVFGILLLGVLAAAGLGYAGYVVHKVNQATKEWAEVGVTTSKAESLMNEIEISFTRFLLDGNSANLVLMQRDRAELEQMEQSQAAGKDQSLKDMIEQEKRWYRQVAPLIEQRKNTQPGQGLSEDFLAHYRASGTSLALVNPVASQGFTSSVQTAYYIQFSVWLVVAYFAGAMLLVVGAFVFALGAFKNVAGLRRTSGPQTSVSS